jgi:FdhD protein
MPHAITPHAPLDHRFTYVQAKRYAAGILSDAVVAVSAEIPYTLFVNDVEILSVATLPCNLEELFVGFLVSEGVLLERNELLFSKVDDDNKLVILEVDVPPERLGKIRKKGMLTSGCAGGVTFSAVEAPRVAERSAPTPEAPAATIVERMAELDRYDGLYRTTRGVHAAALASVTEPVFAVMEDVGRHNAVDKTVGRCFLDGIPTADKMLLTTGRITSEAAIKAARSRFPLVVSRSSVSALALQIARQARIDVASYVRGGRFNYFAHGGARVT